MIAVTPQLTWYVARASGLVAWGLVAASVAWGLALSSRVVQRRGLPAWLLDLHRYLGVLALVFTTTHLVALWADSYVAFGPAELFVPLAATWRPGAVAWGIAAFYLLLAVQLTSWARRRLPKRVWHTIHLSSLPLFVLATVHGVQAGTDSRNSAVVVVAAVLSSAVVFLLVYRVLAPRRSSRVPAAARAAARASSAEPHASISPLS